MSSRILALCLLLVAGSLAAADPAPTVGSVTQSNNREKNGRLIVRTPSILRVSKGGAPLPADARAAIRHYDRVIELSAAPEVRAEALRRAAYLRLRLALEQDMLDRPLAEQAIALYTRLLAEQPDDAGNDLALYQLARATQAIGDEDRAIDALRQLGARHPQSALVADARFRAAELLYVRQRYAEAATEYRATVALGETSRYFGPARYKLGWSLYQQHAHREALEVFLAILDAALPANAPEEPAAALAAVPAAHAEFASEALRVSSLAFIALAGARGIDTYFSAAQEPRFVVLLNLALADALRAQQRYSDAAQVYTTFIERHPQHARAPEFQQRAIASYEEGGFTVPMLAAKAAYAERFAPGAAYWSTQKLAPPPAVMEVLARYDGDLARYHHARAQQLAAGDPARKAEFATAAEWYQRSLDLDIGDAAQTLSLRMLRADALFDGGFTATAAAEYLHAAYAQPGVTSPEAAYAAVQAYQRLATETSGETRDKALRDSIAASLKLAEVYATHPQWLAVLTRAAQDHYALHDDAAAIALAERALQSGRAPTASQRRELLTVVGDAHYTQKNFAKAEAAYLALLPSVDDATQRGIVGERLATAIYRQAETARDAGDLRSAAQSFARVGQSVPGATIRATADYDAAAALIALEEWAPAAAALEGFRGRYREHALLPEVDKKLAVVYDKTQQAAAAAAVYQRIAAEPRTAAALRSEAAWLAAQRYDSARLPAAAARAYEDYLLVPESSGERGLQARRKLADFARDFKRDEPAYRQWLQQIVAIDSRARSELSQQMAAQAYLELGRLDAQAARQIALSAPITQQLPQRRARTEAAITALLRAAQQGDATVTTAATYEIGAIYQDLGLALLRSQRPAALSGDAREQYEILLEEQAEPFERKAIEAHEANLGRVKQGLWDDAIHRSASALGELAPALYGKHEMREDRYAELP